VSSITVNPGSVSSIATSPPLMSAVRRNNTCFSVSLSHSNKTVRSARADQSFRTSRENDCHRRLRGEDRITRAVRTQDPDIRISDLNLCHQVIGAAVSDE
jgi:hypothetical protein